MEKEDILKRAQKKRVRQPDEMELQIEQKGSRLAMFAGMAVCIILMIFKLIANQQWCDVYAVYCLMFGTSWAYKWFKLRRRSDLLYTLCWCLTGLVLLVVSIFQIL